MKLFSMFGALLPISFIKIVVKNPALSTIPTSRALRFERRAMRGRGTIDRVFINTAPEESRAAGLMLLGESAPFTIRFVLRRPIRIQGISVTPSRPESRLRKR